MNIVDRIVNFGNGEFLSRLIEYVIFKPETKEKLKVAVNLWCESPEEAEKKYGHISIWNVSLITDMSRLFEGKEDFQEDISKWNVSNVTDMSYMFCETYFNGNLEDWDVSSVTNMSNMFCGAHEFNQPLEGWDVSNVTNMSSMFYETDEFNQPLNHWDISNVTDMSGMFTYNEVFNRSLKSWDLSTVKIEEMFSYSTDVTTIINFWKNISRPEYNLFRVGETETPSESVEKWVNEEYNKIMSQLVPNKKRKISHEISH